MYFFVGSHLDSADNEVTNKGGVMDFKKIKSILKSQGFTYISDKDGFHYFGTTKASSLQLRTNVALNILAIQGVQAKENNGAILVKIKEVA